MFWIDPKRDYCDRLAKYFLLFGGLMILTCNVGGILFFFAASGIQRRSKAWRIVMLWIFGISIAVTVALAGWILMKGTQGITLMMGVLHYEAPSVWLSILILAIHLGVCIPPFLWLWQPATRIACIQRKAGKDVLLCAACGYNLAGLESKDCPECGHSVGSSKLSRDNVFEAENKWQSRRKGMDS